MWCVLNLISTISTVLLKFYVATIKPTILTLFWIDVTQTVQKSLFYTSVKIKKIFKILLSRVFDIYLGFSLLFPFILYIHEAPSILIFKFIFIFTFMQFQKDPSCKAHRVFFFFLYKSYVHQSKDQTLI